MLKNTFCHIPGIGAQTERRLWEAGLRSWDSVNDHTPAREIIPEKKRNLLEKYCSESAEQLAARNAGWFDGMLPSNQSWRLFGEFRHSVAFLDIETTGLSGDTDHITTIALYDGKSIFHYIKGGNMSDFAERVKNYKLIVTYNGKTFDVPFIRKYLRIPMNHAHIDLRYVLSALGHAGGLKQCEKQFGIEREDSLEGVDGFFAVLLWNDFKRNGNQHALETLLAYNIADVISLETLMTLAYNANVRATPFAATHILPPVESPEIPFKPHVRTIEKLRHQYGW